jgi:hypothetical protein
VDVTEGGNVTWILGWNPLFVGMLLLIVAAGLDGLLHGSAANAERRSGRSKYRNRR